MLNLTKQGLLLQKGKGDSENNIDSGDSESVYMASMLDSGNFVLYDEDSFVVWQSFDHPTDTILGGQNLTTEDDLISSKSKSDHSSGCFYLIMQNDGNLVAYPLYNRFSDLDAYWASNSWNLAYQPHQLSLNIQGFLCLDGSSDRLCLYDINKNRKQSHRNTTSIYRATLDIDGNLRLYEH
ncbi:G-type lectin S-receptor-like serine/threonine protein kinase RLK1-like, partial [Trifolium medium]|nr:G-type lectin S-receptor-like serine/threonine protein kinase RLK1-like [Trifolium medium]